MQLEVPKELVPSSNLQELKEQRKPTFIPVSLETDATKLHDEETGITRRRLANGIPVNYKVCCVYITVFIIGVPYFPCSVYCIQCSKVSFVLHLTFKKLWLSLQGFLILVLCCCFLILFFSTFMDCMEMELFIKLISIIFVLPITL